MRSSRPIPMLILWLATQPAWLPACGGGTESTPDTGGSDGAGSDADIGSDPGPGDAGGDPGGGDPGASLVEARGVWVTRWNYASVSDIRAILLQLAAANFNQVYFQVRGTADAYYASSVEPWARGLSGTLGEDPGWDPLQVAVDEAHALGLELHAWINTLPAWNCGAALPLSAGIPHVLEVHPEWVCADRDGASMLDTCTDGYATLSPGVPEVREHLRSVAEDLLSAYAVDGLHLDYIRYPGPGYSYDPLGEEAYAIDLQARPGLAHADWQREQVDDAVRQVFETLLQVRPAATLSAAVWFVYRNEWGWSSVSEGYPDYYQDPRAWTAAGTIDALAPMIYFPLTDPPGGRLDFYTLLQDHLQGNPGRFVLAGIKADYPDFSEIAAQIAAARELQAAGFILFAYSSLVERDTFDDLAAGPLSEPAAAPRRPWRP